MFMVKNPLIQQLADTSSQPTRQSLKGELESNPAAVRGCFGISAFRHLVAWI
jgi:hypothetical protein